MQSVLSRINFTCVVRWSSIPHIFPRRITPVLFSGFSSSSDESRPTPVDYQPYREFETPSPYRLPLRGRRFGFKVKHHTGGVLPRPESMKYNPVASLPPFKVSNPWSEKNAVFGQNDYIDILGDGTVHPWELLKAPAWLKGWSGSWMQHLVRRERSQRKFLKEYQPYRYYKLLKEINYQYKRLNYKRRRRVYR